MDINDLTFEVRDITLARLGVLLPEYINFDGSDLHNNSGSWSLSLPVEHPLATDLRVPGAGIVVSGPDGKEILSGPTIKPELQQTPSDIRGQVVIEGVTDSIVLADALAFPDPIHGLATEQTKARDERAGAAESLLHQFVNANIGPGAPANRRKPNLLMGTDLGRGGQTTKGARFPVLGALLEEIAGPANLGYRVIQRGDNLVFETYEIADRSRTIRLDVLTGTLASQRVGLQAPSATRVIVAGQNEGVDRQFLIADTPASIAAEAAWGRRVERFVDQRQTDDLAELQQAADEVLADDGLTAVTIQAVPSEDSSMRFGRDYNVGDRVSVVTDGQELSSVITGMVLKVDSEGVRTGLMVGDPAGFSTEALLKRRVVNAERRLSQLERSDAAGAPAPTPEGGQSMNFTFATATTFWNLPHNFGSSRPITVTCFDTNGDVLIGDVNTTDSPNTAYVEWFYPTAGSARVQS